MSMPGARRIFFIGLHPSTPLILDAAPLEVAAVAHLDYFRRFTLHPAHMVFQLCYAACRIGTTPLIRYPASVAWRLARPHVRGTYARYAAHLSWLLKSKARVIPVDKVSAAVSFVEQNDIELLVVNSWSLLPESLVRAPRRGAINIHPSRLPQYRGALPTLWSLKNRDTHSAVSLLIMGSGVDDGALLAQHGFEIRPDATSIDIEQAIDALIAAHLHADILSYLERRTELQKQTGTPSSTARYESYRVIAWREETARDIINKILLYPHIEPFVYCMMRLNGIEAEIRHAVTTPTAAVQPGHFVVEKLTVHCGAADGTISCRLFRDMGMRMSLTLLSARTGTLD